MWGQDAQLPEIQSNSLKSLLSPQLNEEHRLFPAQG